MDGTGGGTGGRTERERGDVGASSVLCKRPFPSFAPQAVGAVGKWESWFWILAGLNARISEVLTLLKREGEWLITQKTFHWHQA